MDRETAYVTSIPEQAREKIKLKFRDGSRHRAEYYIDNERVGLRSFYPGGELEDEWSYRNGKQHGWYYRWDSPGKLLSASPYEDGMEHGTAYQWGRDGRLVGSYTMEHGTGLDLWWQDTEDGTAYLHEARYYVNGFRHGYEWILMDGQLWQECHYWESSLHGIERHWNFKGGLRRGYPRYWVRGEKVTKRQYVRAASQDASLPPFRAKDNKPHREFPPEVARHLFT